jgi:outer membrane receptor protein involved in Fe transport
VAIYPQGQFPCVNGVQTPSCTLTLPVGPPTFERSNRYHEYALYFQDSWKVSPRVTVNLGLRWEYFGVQHNVNANLDSNFYPASGGNRTTGYCQRRRGHRSHQPHRRALEAQA